MILHNAAGVAMVLLALAAAQGRGTDIGGTTGQGDAGSMAAAHAATNKAAPITQASTQTLTMDQRGDAATQDAAIDAMSSMHMSDDMAGPAAMSAHMAWSDSRPATDADRARAAEIVKTLQTALVKYKDYRVAEADGFKPFHPELPQNFYHFTRWQNGLKAAFTFDPVEPTSLLYKKTANGGYKLIGAMYTAPRTISETKLDQRVPLSVARWHRHVDLCFPAKGQGATADWTKFGFAGSIATKADCDAAGGRFYPQVFGWMVHVYPWATTQETAWAH
jgi:hypothetical protein